MTPFLMVIYVLIIRRYHKMTTEETNKDNVNTEAPATDATASTTTAPKEGQPGAGQAAGLTIGDLRLMARLVQISSERGAIRADEMATVGDLYNRLSQFLNTVAPVAPAPQPADSTAPESTDAPAETNEESVEGTESTEGSQGE